MIQKEATVSVTDTSKWAQVPGAPGGQKRQVKGPVSIPDRRDLLRCIMQGNYQKGFVLKISCLPRERNLMGLHCGLK